MIQDPNPLDDPEMEQFCDWLYEAGFSNQMKCPDLQEIWRRGLADYYGSRLTGTGKIDAQEYERLVEAYRRAVKDLFAGGEQQKGGKHE